VGTLPGHRTQHQPPWENQISALVSYFLWRYSVGYFLWRYSVGVTKGSWEIIVKWNKKHFFCRCFEQLIGRKTYKPLHICAVIQSVKWTAFTGTNSPDAPFGNSRIHLKQRTILLRHKVVQEWRPFNPWWHFTTLFFWYMCVPTRSLSLCRNWMCTSLGECNMAHAKRR